VKTIAYYWAKAKFGQLCVLLGLKLPAISYLSTVLLEEYGFQQWCVLETSAMILELDYPWAWQYRKYIKEHQQERSKP
jgi:hypothetical protein